METLEVRKNNPSASSQFRLGHCQTAKPEKLRLKPDRPTVRLRRFISKFGRVCFRQATCSKRSPGLPKNHPSTQVGQRRSAEVRPDATKNGLWIIWIVRRLVCRARVPPQYPSGAVNDLDYLVP
ncbi:hypothetical protein RUM44_012283 [Polyplax serrata]|uniref:Uncharacterized protein n=1 Tax=Polyplax serrata TaxID=468196 RepID=A0ABR1BF39_POLSC